MFVLAQPALQAATTMAVEELSSRHGACQVHLRATHNQLYVVCNLVQMSLVNTQRLQGLGVLIDLAMLACHVSCKDQGNGQSASIAHTWAVYGTMCEWP